MNPTHTHDVAIIGAGIAGSCLAKALADKGWSTLLLDRQHFPRHKVCGEFFSPESRGMLNAFGLRGLVDSLHPSLISQTRLISSEGDTMDIALPGVGLGMSRYALDSALHQEALKSGVQVSTATTVTSVYAEDKGYVIETKTGQQNKTYFARAAIAAWGANRRSGILGEHIDDNVAASRTYMGVKSHFTGIDIGPTVELYFFRGGYLGISPIEGGLVNVAALLMRKEFKDADKSILGLIEAAASRNPELQQKLAHAEAVKGSQAAVAPVDLKRKPIAWDVIAHVGDAAQMIAPLCGDGMSMALRSAELCEPLAHRYLQGEISLSMWEDQYKKALQRDFNRPLRWGRMLQALFNVPMMPRMLLGAAHVMPDLAYKLVQATRLKETHN